jgi:hypothetical protein
MKIFHRNVKNKQIELNNNLFRLDEKYINIYANA